MISKGKADASQLELTLHSVELDMELMLAPNPRSVNERWVTHTMVSNVLVDSIADQFKQSDYSPAYRFRKAVYAPIISTILANLLNAHNHGLQVVYSRRKEGGKSIHQWVGVWDFLASKGLICNVTAAKNIKGIKSWASSLPELASLFKHHKSKVALSKKAPSVVVRDNDKNILPIPKYRNHKIKYNRFVKVADKFNALWHKHTATLNNRTLVPFGQRKFKGSIDFGGRFYAEYQQLSSEDRQLIRIDDHSTIEPDYSSMHLAILYAWQGVQIDYDEAYTLQGYESTVRPVVKGVILRALNIADIGTLCRIVTLSANPSNQRKYAKYKHARQAHDHRRQKGLKSAAPYKAKWIDSFIEGVPFHTNAKDLVDAILTKHKVIKSYIGTPRLGLKLQAVDSEIMSCILDKLTTLNIPVLPVHDSIICKVKDKALTIKTMSESFKEITGFDAQIKWPDDDINNPHLSHNLSLF